MSGERRPPAPKAGDNGDQGNDSKTQRTLPLEASSPPPLHADHRKRLRQRFLDGDQETFADYELLELLLFYSIERVDVKPLAKQLLRDFQGLRGVLSAEDAPLLRYPRVNDRTLALFRVVREAARRLALTEVMERPVISSFSALVDYCRITLAGESTERFRVIYLNRKNMVIADDPQQRGTVDHTPVYPREVIKRALELGATALIMVHNHPSGDPTPSAPDIAMTREVRDAAIKLGINLYDHVIVGRTGTTSMRSLGLIE